MRDEIRTDAARPRTVWRFFPWSSPPASASSMVVNFAMMGMAVRSFPGLATTNGFDHSNGYDQVLAAAERQAALGWTVRGRARGGRAR